MINIGLYGPCDKRAIVFGLFKLLQDFGAVLFITKERHYRRLIDDREFGYFQNVLICSSDETPDTIFTELNMNPETFDFVIWDTTDNVPDKLDISFICSCYRDELLFDDIVGLYDNPVTVKFLFDSKREKSSYNVAISTALFKYLELTEAYKVLKPFTFGDISKIFETELAPMLDIRPKTVKGILRKGWQE